MATNFPISKLPTRQLTPFMLLTLKAACRKQINNEPIEKIDLDGCFMALRKRGFIDSRIITVKGKNEVSWYVTIAGIKSLNELAKEDE